MPGGGYHSPHTDLPVGETHSTLARFTNGTEWPQNVYMGAFVILASYSMGAMLERGSIR